MRRNVPTVLEDDPLRAVVTAVSSSRMHVAVVLDEWRHVQGLITDSELVEHLTLAARPNTAGKRGRVRAAGETPTLQARDVMRPEPATSFADTPAGQALKTMLDAHQKVLPLVDNAWRLEGIIDRSDLLNWLARS